MNNSACFRGQLHCACQKWEWIWRWFD